MGAFDSEIYENVMLCNSIIPSPKMLCIINEEFIACLIDRNMVLVLISLIKW